MTNFSLNWYSNIDSFAKKLQALLVAWGGVNLRHMHVIWLKAFLYWLKNQICCGINIYYNYNEDFGQVKLQASIKALEAFKNLRKAGDSKTKAPEKFQPSSLHRWTSLNWELENYLDSLRGILGVPLLYVIREKEMNEVTLPREDAAKNWYVLCP